MGQSLANVVHKAIEKQPLLHAGERVGVAVSGGADSVALLLLLLELRPKLGVVLSVVHFNHKLRGKAADADERSVAKLAAKHGLVCRAGSADVGLRAKRDKTNLEDTARRARYEFFATLVQAGQLDKIAVAHTLDDQAETVLAHILRGTGLAGLGGIHPLVGHIVRPLLTVRRAELRAYLRSKKQTWREDATNRDTAKMRARIRKTLLPIIEKRFQPAVVNHLATLSELAREDEALIEALLSERFQVLVRRFEQKRVISVADLLHPLERLQDEQRARSGEPQNRAACKRLVRRIVKEIKPHSGQLNAHHVESVLELARRGENGKCLLLPGGADVRRTQDSLYFDPAVPRKKLKNNECQNEFAFPLQLDGGAAEIALPQLGCVFRFKVIDWPAKRGETSKKESVLDRDALRAPLVLRNWHPGDRFQPVGHRKARKLKRFLNEKHISRWERDGWPVLASGDVLVWVRGFPVAAGFAACEKTRAGMLISEETIS